MSVLVTEQSNAPYESHRSRSIELSRNIVSAAESLIAGLVVFTISFVTGLVLVFKYKLMYGDAFARVMSGYYTVAQGKFHLAAIGFVWNPLPALLELPLDMLQYFWRPILQLGLPGNFLSALFSGVAAFYLTKLLGLFGVGRTGRLVWVGLFALNPMILLYSANGMSEMMLIASMIAALYGLIDYLQSSKLSSLVLGGMWLGIGFIIRYEAIPFALCVGVGAMIYLLRQRTSRYHIESTAFVYGFPIFSAVITWLYLNWMIMGSPLYFLNSNYSNAAQTATGEYNSTMVYYAHHHIFHALASTVIFSKLFLPVIPLLIIVFFLSLRPKSDQLGWLLLGATVAVPLLQVVLLYKGSSAAWGRFFIYYIPFSFVLSAYLIYNLPSRARKMAVALLSMVLIFGDYTTWIALHNPVVGKGDTQAVAAVQHNQPMTEYRGNVGQSVGMPEVNEAKAVAHYINTHPNLTVLFDTFSNNFIFAYIDRPSQVIITSDRNFKSVLQQPRGRVDAILVPNPNGINAVDTAYPKLWSGSLPWAHLITQIPGSSQYRLYAVGPNAP